MSNEHTPGPWVVQRESYKQTCLRVETIEGEVLARVPDGDDPPRIGDPAANAQLMAMAQKRCWHCGKIMSRRGNVCATCTLRSKAMSQKLNREQEPEQEDDPDRHSRCLPIDGMSTAQRYKYMQLHDND